ncbi:patatin-like phospholipase domain-containing protein 4 [Asterias rubens]|uniref:patatin-like phospholipase domain-containing protein 4 n=1 Tax=Asterias rubens TaxID=7604 RepID=UPI001455A875|nr:patatin-like phospholipase domain-containing protein 4 [Asterias rubens]
MRRGTIGLLNYRGVTSLTSTSPIRRMTRSRDDVIVGGGTDVTVISEISPCDSCTHLQSTPLKTSNSIKPGRLDLTLREEVNVSFAGCGFLAIYHLGVATCLLRKGQHFISNVTRWGGSSAGAIAAAAMVCLPNKLGDAVQMLRDFVDTFQKKPLGPLTPGFNMMDYLRTELEYYIPSDAHILAKNKLYVSVTRVADGKNILLTEFHSREELIEALLCSCYIPVYCGFRIPTFRGQKYIDGGVTANMPFYPVGRTICVSPFSGHLQDICPADRTWLDLSYVVAGHSFRVCSQNVWRALMALFTPSQDTLDEYLERGDDDATNFLKENGMLKKDTQTNSNEQ